MTTTDGNGPRLLVVIPAWNEEANVGQVVKEVRAAMPGAGVLVVDDGSRDRTAAVAASAGAEVLCLPFNLGVGGAMRAGYRFAVREGYDVVAQVDGDGQHDPQDLPRMLQALSDADVVVGGRDWGPEGYPVRGPRRWAMRIIAWTIRRMTGARVTDTTSGFRVCGPKAVRVFAETYPVEYLGDTVEALLIAHRRGCRITEVPVRMRERAGGAPSQSPLRAAIYLMRAGMAIALAVVRR